MMNSPTVKPATVKVNNLTHLLQDPLILLRRYNIKKRVIIVKNDRITFGRFSWPKTVRTNFRIYETGKNGNKKQYYTLECLLHFLKNASLSHPIYKEEAAELDIPTIRRRDRRDLVAYLQGTISTCRSIDGNAPIEPATQVRVTETEANGGFFCVELHARGRLRSAGKTETKQKDTTKYMNGPLKNMHHHEDKTSVKEKNNDLVKKPHGNEDKTEVKMKNDLLKKSYHADDETKKSTTKKMTNSLKEISIKKPGIEEKSADVVTKKPKVITFDNLRTCLLEHRCGKKFDMWNEVVAKKRHFKEKCADSSPEKVMKKLCLKNGVVDVLSNETRNLLKIKAKKVKKIWGIRLNDFKESTANNDPVTKGDTLKPKSPCKISVLTTAPKNEVAIAANKIMPNILSTQKKVNILEAEVNPPSKSENHYRAMIVTLKSENADLKIRNAQLRQISEKQMNDIRELQMSRDELRNDVKNFKKENKEVETLRETSKEVVKLRELNQALLEERNDLKHSIQSIENERNLLYSKLNDINISFMEMRKLCDDDKIRRTKMETKSIKLLYAYKNYKTQYRKLSEKNKELTRVSTQLNLGYHEINRSMEEREPSLLSMNVIHCVQGITEEEINLCLKEIIKSFRVRAAELIRLRYENKSIREEMKCKNEEYSQIIEFARERIVSHEHTITKLQEFIKYFELNEGNRNKEMNKLRYALKEALYTSSQINYTRDPEKDLGLISSKANASRSSARFVIPEVMNPKPSVPKMIINNNYYVNDEGELDFDRDLKTSIINGVMKSQPIEKKPVNWTCRNCQLVCMSKTELHLHLKSEHLMYKGSEI